ncbi:hypothetical protein L2E82_38323 [Cichorium intybus]|uniref:Uncharacterized protein n=1 Tax=Cichorium intybus TaxID=13427 RepID=A0ACB9AFV0_CICIN|nr:hypothetical protein L2E82_38323 [Cichorium intybus]
MGETSITTLLSWKVPSPFFFAVYLRQAKLCLLIFPNSICSMSLTEDPSAVSEHQPSIPPETFSPLCNTKAEDIVESWVIALNLKNMHLDDSIPNGNVHAFKVEVCSSTIQHVLVYSKMSSAAGKAPAAGQAVYSA